MYSNLIEVIGKAVWLLKDNGHGIWNIDKDRKLVIESLVKPGENLPDGTPNEDWCSHVVLLDTDGTFIHVPEWQTVICPEDFGDKIMSIQRYVSDNGLYADVYDNFDGLPVVHASIHWGDWKHDHLWCKKLMEYIGYVEIGCNVTEENGSDCYSAIHNFMKLA